MSDEITITLPVSGKEVVIRNYTTNGDDEKYEEVLYQGVQADQDMKGSSSKLAFPVANIMAAQKVYIPRLVKSIDGKSTNILYDLRELRSIDYKAIEDAVEEIVNQSSPKAQEVAANTKSASTES